MKLRCDCGCEELITFGPYKDGSGDAGTGPVPNDDDVGLRWVFTCGKCGEQLRVYQTSDAWRKRHGLHDAVSAAAFRLVDMAARASGDGS